jgi:hypothetical protein
MNAATIKEMMDRYNEAKAMWISKLGSKFDEAAFHAWFTEQVIGK